MQVKKDRKEFIEKISGLASNKNTKFLTDNLACERVLLSIGSAEETIYRFPWFSPDQIDTTQERSIDQDLLDGSKINFFFPRKLEDIYNPKLLISCIPDIIKNNRGAKQLHFTFLGYGSQMNDCVRLVKNLQIEDNCSFIRYLPENSFIKCTQEFRCNYLLQ